MGTVNDNDTLVVLGSVVLVLLVVYLAQDCLIAFPIPRRSSATMAPDPAQEVNASTSALV
jgi:hypothetical protein